MITYSFTSHKENNLRTTIATVNVNGSVFTGETIQMPKDQDNKLIGQKVALTKAIKNADKFTRTAVWKLFLTSKKINTCETK